MKTITMAACALIVAGCSPESPEAGAAGSLTFETIINDGSSFQRAEPWTFVIRSKSEEEGFLATSGAQVDFPEIDYSEKMVICLLVGRRASVDATVTIDSVVQLGESVKVFSHEAATEDFGEGESYPSHIIVLDIVKKGVEFVPDPLAVAMM